MACKPQKTAILTKALGLIVLACVSADGRKFYHDDPIRTMPKPRHTGQVLNRKISDYYDFFLHTLAEPGERHTKRKAIPAQAVNTLGEVPDNSWYTNRHYHHPMTIEKLQRGPGNTDGPSMEGPWTVVAAKSEGVTPGFTIVDSRRRRYLLKFDPLDHPEMATAPDVLVSKFFYALGYHVPQNYIVFFTRERLVLGESVEITDEKGKTREMTDGDIDDILRRVPRAPDGRYRGGASLFLKGRPVGPFRYHGTRRDDPNDIYPHEHRRDLRGLSVFCAWLGHDDSRSINTLDMLVEEDGVRFVKHHLIDFGSTLGSASTKPNSPRSGHEYLFDWKPASRQFLTFGLWVPAWAKAKYPNLPAVGRFEAERFDAAGWVAEYPNPAFENRLPDDAFWAARQVMAFTDEQIRAVVKTGEYSDPAAEKWIADALIVRRDKIGRAFLTRLLPLDRFEIRDGRLVFEDLGMRHGLVSERSLKAQWSVFDNEKEVRTPLAGETDFRVPGIANAEYLACEISSGNPGKPVIVYVRRKAAKTEVVGIDRTW